MINFGPSECNFDFLVHEFGDLFPGGANQLLRFPYNVRISTFTDRFDNSQAFDEPQWRHSSNFVKFELGQTTFGLDRSLTNPESSSWAREYLTF